MRTQGPMATSRAFKKLKPLEVIVHEIRFSGAGADALITEQAVKSVQLGASLSSDKATADTQSTYHAIKPPGASPAVDADGVLATSEPVAISPNWSYRVGLGPSSAGLTRSAPSFDRYLSLLGMSHNEIADNSNTFHCKHADGSVDKVDFNTPIDMVRRE